MTLMRWIVLFSFVTQSLSFQFFLDARTRKCFREDIPLSTEASLTYTVAQGDGDMQISLRVTDMSGAVVFSRDAIDHGVYSFRAPDSIPGVKERHNWEMRDDEKDEEDDAYYRAMPGGAGDDRVWYRFCFEHTAGVHLSLRGNRPRRRVIFHVRSGSDARTLEYYDKLAKEKHLTSTEELFRVVEDRVSDIVRVIDEMRQRELRLAHMSMRTSKMVGWYSVLACLSILAGAAIASYATFQHLTREKVV